MRERLSSVFKLALSSMVTSVALTLGVSEPARANVVYTYTGNDFTSVTGLYTTSDFVTATITLTTALPPNTLGVDLVKSPNLVSFTMSDGVQTLTLAPPAITGNAIVGTDSSGNISTTGGWVVDLVNNLALGTPTIETECCGALLTSDTGESVGIGANGNTTEAPGNPGTWSITSPTPAVPLPAALPLFASGLVGLGLLGWRRKKAA